ncbi:MFS transporter [Lacicoccus alkaliphilus]|uniref:Predicted arabinose efflux permease, MFS family n=1 Tax=Lacicoccus alkaliphilus DSM 16010 TaxID=1123231 RepID=A0A1M7BWE8_9BACL|nr:MFS transporter [Salinicoccus alkaliphilus]SHL59311.1 Predicted arabinose efflux permease, MFS family [Salinicoccus alkaliphilus DSM 16010]
MNAQPNRQAAVMEDRIWTRDFVFVCLANFFVFLGFQMTLPTLPLFLKELGGNDRLVGVIVGVFTFSALLLRPYAGHALESKGRGFVYMVGLAVFVISIASFSFISSILLLFLLRVLQGMGWGFSTTAGGTIATDIIPPKRRGEGLGYFGLSGNLALALGPTLGLTLVGVISFAQLFMICAGFGLIALLFASRIRYKKVEKSEAAASPVRFDIFERTAIQPAILLFFITATFGGIATFLPIFAIERGIAGIELYFLLYAAFLMISRSFAGRIYDKRGHLYVFMPGALMIFIAMLMLAWLPNTAVLLIAASLYGLGFGSVQPALQAWSVENAPANRRGMANATFFSFFDLGIGLGAILFGQMAYIFGYASIYAASAGSVLMAMIIYIFLYVRAKRMQN